MNKTETIKPCPFCGSDKIDPCFALGMDINNNYVYGYGCDDCGATGGMTSSKEASLKEWNKRA